MAFESVTAATMCMRPWQRGHSSASTRNTRRRRSAQGSRYGGYRWGAGGFVGAADEFGTGTTFDL